MKEETKAGLKKVFLNLKFTKAILSLIFFIVVTKIPLDSFVLAENRAILVILSAFFLIYHLDRWGDSYK
jgi:hypothetical protein